MHNIGKTATGILEMIQKVFGNEALSYTQVFKWYSHFKSNITLVDDEHPGGSTSSVGTQKQRQSAKNHSFWLSVDHSEDLWWTFD